MHESKRETKSRVTLALLLPLLLLLGACSQNVESLGGKEAPPAPDPIAVQLANAAGAGSAAPGTPPAGGAPAEQNLNRGVPPGITGEVQISPELADEIGPNAVLFLIARVPDGPPLAAKRVANPTFPLRFFIGQESAMFDGQALEGEVDLIARISQSGVAAPVEPGDLEGICTENPIEVGSPSVIEIRIDTRRS